MTFDAEDFLIAEAIFPGLTLGYVECICRNCGEGYTSEYIDGQEEYDCENCGCPNTPI